MLQTFDNKNTRPVGNLSPSMGMKVAEGVEKEALNLQAGLSGSNLGATRATLRQLRMLAGSLTGSGKRAAAVQGTISGAIARAQSKIEQLEIEENRRAHSCDPGLKFDLAVYSMMSGRDRRFYDSIDEKQRFVLPVVTEEGELDPYAIRTLDGKSLKRLVSLLKFHSLDTAGKKKVLQDTFGTEAAEEEGTPRDAAVLRKKKEELLELHRALSDLEAYKAYLITRKYRPQVAALLIERNHKIIAGAHRRIDEVEARYDDALKDVDNGMAVAMLKASKLKMKQVLRDEVVEQVLLDQEATAPLITGGVPVSEPMAGFGSYGSGSASSGCRQPCAV
jgi:hypothetical protein